MSVIVSIEKLNNEFELGYLVKTADNGEIKITMDNSRMCCETYYANAMHNKQNVDTRLDEWNGRFITDVVISPKQGRVYRDYETADEDEYDCDARYRTVSIYTEKGEYPLVIYLYNCHNGYYPHRCFISLKKIQGVSISNTDLSFSL